MKKLIDAPGTFRTYNQALSVKRAQSLPLDTVQTFIWVSQT
jgi:hypothetical protein